jgi:hypothetical protein
VASAATAVGSQPRAIDSVLDSPLTQTGVLIGTPAYMAPEQFAGRAPDPRSDQFAFCVTVWEALTGARPFRGQNLDELRAAAAAGPPGAGQVPEAVLPARVRATLARGLSPAPGDRWPDMRAVLAALEAAFAPPRRSRVPLIAGISLAVIGFLTGVAVYTQSHTRAANERVEPVVPVPPPVPMPPMPPAIPDPEPSRAIGRCKPADAAFGSAWSAERRAAVIARHRTAHQLVPVTAMLDEVRGAWRKSYEEACAMPASERRDGRLDCLNEVRDSIDEVTHDLADDDDSEPSVVLVVPLNVAVGVCKRG